MERGTRLAALVLVLATVAAAQGGDRWVWGRRNVAAAADNVPQQTVLQRRHGRFIRPSSSSFFKSIGRHSPEPTANPLNALHAQDKQKTSIKPSPVDTSFVSHFDVINQKDLTVFPQNIRKIPAEISRPQLPVAPGIVSPGEYPFPFAAKPIDLGDGTSIGWAPEDTLPVKTKRPEVVKPITEEQDARYTTLDKLFDSREPTNLPDTRGLPNDVLGGLHPDEVFYADKDIVIIRGGGFSSTDSVIANDLTNDIDRGTQHAGNQFTDDEDVQVIDVRPDDAFASVPLPFRFINGNIPTIVKAGNSPSSRQSNRRYQPSQSHGFRPIHQESFRPISPQAQRFHTSPSDQVQKYVSLSEDSSNVDRPRDIQSLGEEEVMVALPSLHQPFTLLPPVKRSADNKVVHYQYQTRGNNQPIVDFKIHKNGNTEMGTTEHRKQPSRNSIPVSEKESVEDNKKSRESGNTSSGDVTGKDNSYAELEDFSLPAVQNFVPKTQVPKRRPATPRPTSTYSVPPSPTPTYSAPPRQSPTYSVPPRQSPTYSVPPRQSSTYSAPSKGTNRQKINSGSQRPPFNPSVQLPANFRPSQPPRGATKQPPTGGHFYTGPPAPQRQKPISLKGDTRVNFLAPRPAINPEAEVLLHNPTSRPSFVSTRAIATRPPHRQVLVATRPPQFSHTQLHQFPPQQRPQLHRLHPQVHRLPPQVHRLRPQVHQLTPQHLQQRQRFMEPRRRQPLRARQAPRL